MNVRTFLKTIAFVVGLYFVLEYILPTKVGGDFDNYEVLAPSFCETPAGDTLFYTGVYKKHKTAVGRLVKEKDSADQTAAAWPKFVKAPVMRSSLFIPYDRWEMVDLDVEYGLSNLFLFYLGSGPRYDDILCYSVSSDEGTTWIKKGPVVTIEDGIGKSEKSPNGVMPGIIRKFAAEYDQGWKIWFILDSKKFGTCVWRITGDDLSNMTADAEPIFNRKRVPKSFAGFDVFKGKKGYDCLYVSENKLIASSLDNTQFETIHTFPTNINKMTGMRFNSKDKMVYYSAIIDETNDFTYSAIFSLDLADNSPAKIVKKVGKAAKSTYLSKGITWTGQGMAIMGSFAVFLAVINLLIFHSKSIYRNAMEISSDNENSESPEVKKKNADRKSKIFNSLVFLIFMFLMIPFAYMGTPEDAAGTNWRVGFDFLFQSIQVPMGSAIFSMITFYLISAAYRSFRMRSLEATLLMIAAMICMVGQMPVGFWLTSRMPYEQLQLQWLAQKLLLVINSAAYRGVFIGMLIGGISISLRIWLGIDNSVYANVDKK